MASTIKQIIAVKYPGGESDARIDTFIEISKLRVSTALGARYNLLVALDVCHQLALEAMTGGSATAGSTSATGGALTGVKEGALSKTFAAATLGMGASAGSEGWYALTSFGREFLAVRAGAVMCPRTQTIEDGGI